MERLTKRSEDKNSTMVWFVDKESYDMRYEPCEMDSSQRRKVLCKLADYEDTGLSPTMVLDTIKARDMAQKQALENAHIVDDYRQAEEQGLLLRLPCKVGTTVYQIHTLQISKKTILAEVETDAFFMSLCLLEGRFGKTVFLTKEEAEQALAEMQKGKV